MIIIINNVTVDFLKKTNSHGVYIKGVMVPNLSYHPL